MKIAFETGDTVEQAFAARRDTALRPAVDEALATLRSDGTLAQISEKWFGEDVSQGGRARRGGARLAATPGTCRRLVGPLLSARSAATIPLTADRSSSGWARAGRRAGAAVAAGGRLGVARAYVSLIRGTPLLVQLFIIFYALPSLGPHSTRSRRRSSRSR